MDPHFSIVPWDSNLTIDQKGGMMKRLAGIGTKWKAGAELGRIWTWKGNIRGVRRRLWKD